MHSFSNEAHGKNKLAFSFLAPQRSTPWQPRARSARSLFSVLSGKQLLQPFRLPRAEVLSENLFDKLAKICRAAGAKFFNGIRAKHSVTLELRFGEKLVSRALVRECFAPLKVFVNVAWFVAVTRRLDVNNNAIGRVRTSTAE